MSARILPRDHEKRKQIASIAAKTEERGEKKWRASAR